MGERMEGVVNTHEGMLEEWMDKAQMGRSCDLWLDGRGLLMRRSVNFQACQVECVEHVEHLVRHIVRCVKLC